MNKYWTLSGLTVIYAMFSLYAAVPVGWACFATVGGSVYKVKVGGTPMQISGISGAKHARWSVDGKLIFYVDGSGNVWSINNDGTEKQQIGSGALVTNYNAIGAYRPDATCVMVIKNGSFYCMSSVTRTETLIGKPGIAVLGECSISMDGKRIAFRKDPNGGVAYDVVSGDFFQYYDKCSASISPDGNWTTGNHGSHLGTYVFSWWSKTSTLLPCPFSTNDNQSFAVNSDDWICALKDNHVNANLGKGCGIVNRVTKETYTVAAWTVGDVAYPDFFLGELPDPGITSARTNSAPAAAFEPRFALSGQGMLTVSPATSGSYTVKLFNAKGAVIGSFGGNAARTFDLSAVRGLVIVKMQAGNKTFVQLFGEARIMYIREPL